MNLPTLIDSFQHSSVFNLKFIVALQLFSRKEQFKENITLTKQLMDFLQDVVNANQKKLESGSLLDRVFASSPADDKNRQSELLTLWSAFGSEEVKLALANPVLLANKKNLADFLKKIDSDVFKYTNPSLWQMFEASPEAETTVSDDSVSLVNHMLLDLGGDSNKSRIWCCSTLLTKIVTSNFKSLNYSNIFQAEVIYLLLFGVVQNNRTLEYLFNLLDFALYFHARIKPTKINDLLWFRLSYLFWQLSTDRNSELKQQLQEKYNIEDQAQEVFFKIISFYCLNMIQDMRTSYCLDQAQRLKSFIASLSTGSLLDAKVFTFIKYVLSIDLTLGPKVLDSSSCTLIGYLYEDYRKTINSETICPLMRIVTETLSVNLAKTLSGSLEISCLGSMLADSQKRLLAETALVEDLQIRLRTLQTSKKTDDDRLSKEMTELKQSADQLKESRDLLAKNLDDGLKQLAKLDNLQDDARFLDKIKLHCTSLGTTLASFKALKTPDYNSYYSRYLYLVCRFMDEIFALWIQALTPADHSSDLLTRKLIIKRIRQCELSFDTLKTRKLGIDGELAPFSIYVIEDFIIRINRLVDLLSSDDVKPSAHEQLYIDFIITLGGQFDNQALINPDEVKERLSLVIKARLQLRC